jgi:hypothetical protein
MLEAYFTEFDNESNWVRGKVGIYNFSAKLYNTPSQFGIDGGRVSKLSIYDGSVCFVNYDRGWDITPIKEDEEYFDTVMELLENSEERDLDD